MRERTSRELLESFSDPRCTCAARSLVGDTCGTACPVHGAYARRAPLTGDAVPGGGTDAEGMAEIDGWIAEGLRDLNRHAGTVGAVRAYERVTAQLRRQIVEATAYFNTELAMSDDLRSRLSTAEAQVDRLDRRLQQMVTLADFAGRPLVATYLAKADEFRLEGKRYTRSDSIRLTEAERERDAARSQLHALREAVARLPRYSRHQQGDSVYLADVLALFPAESAP